MIRKKDDNFIEEKNKTRGAETTYRLMKKPKSYFTPHKWKSPRVQFFIENKEIKPEDAPQAITVLLMSPKKPKEKHP